MRTRKSDYTNFFVTRDIQGNRLILHFNQSLSQQQEGLLTAKIVKLIFSSNRGLFIAD
jgi:hypothetical protein